MKPEFKIFKSGVTDRKVTIVSEKGKPFNKEAKIQKYLDLGYIIYDLYDKQITTPCTQS